MPKAKEHTVSIKKKTTERDFSLDYLRGFAVFLMILAHTIHFIHSNENSTLRFLEGVGNTLAFTIFLFVSGAVTYLAYLKSDSIKKKASSILRRAAYLLLGYYFIAIAASLNEFSWPFSSVILSKLVRILTFQNVPGFTEFVLPFIIVSLLIFLLFPVYKIISKNVILAIIAGLITFVIGAWLFTFDTSETLASYKALFVGHEGYYRFPLLQYFMIYFLGLAWGRLSLDIKKMPKNIAFKLGLLFLFAFGVAELASAYYNLPFLQPLNRWPPSLGFISIGVAFTFYAIIFIKNLINSKLIDPINRFFIYIGQDAFDMFIFSTFILFVYQYITEYRTTEMIVVFVAFFILIGLSMLFSSFNSFGSPSLFREGTDIIKKQQKLFRKRYVVLSILMLVVIFTNLRIPVYSDVAGAVVTRKDLEELAPIEKGVELPWWNNEFGYYRQLTVENTHPISSIFGNTQIEFEFDHQKFVENGKSLETGVDLRLVYLSSDGYQDVEFDILSPNTDEARLQFFIQRRIFPNRSDNRYFLYYGNNFAESALYAGKITPEDNEALISLGTEVKHPLFANVNKKWQLIDSPNVDLENLILTVSVNDPDLFNSDLSFKILGKDDNLPLEQADPTLYQAEIPVENLTAGKYTLQPFAKTEDGIVEGQKVNFYLSHPMYVTWTIDWEGYDESDQSLSSLESISSDFDIPLTHFFNPRIYITEGIEKSRSQELTNWVKNRNEPIGLHLHMHKDLVKAAGVEPKDGPRWAKFKEDDGYDVPTTEYSEEELTKIISWGVDQFETNSLGTPTMYRAGGWFADLKVLQILEDIGFELDSSGRKPELWWSKYSNIWNLKDTTQPYKPSKTDQNTSDGPTFDLWEFPTNGGDSTAYDASQLIEKFNANYSGVTLEEKKLITYISHPRWFDVDGPKMQEVFEHIDNFSFEEDSGPVIFITLEQALSEWSK